VYGIPHYGAWVPYTSTMTIELPPDGRAGRKVGVVNHNTKTCSFPDCENTSHARGLCRGHWRQWYTGREFAPLRPHRKVIDGHKVCGDCLQNLPVSEFHKKKNSTVQVMCKACTSIHLRAKEYGLTHDEVRALLAQSCNACGAEVDGRNAHIDHCHRKGHVRGLLCMACNTALGAVNDSPARLWLLIDYLERTGMKPTA
jgi:hypothetical protein